MSKKITIKYLYQLKYLTGKENMSRIDETNDKLLNSRSSVEVITLKSSKAS